jgi:hypothetical protein
MDEALKACRVSARFTMQFEPDKLTSLSSAQHNQHPLIAVHCVEHNNKLDAKRLLTTRRL